MTKPYMERIKLQLKDTVHILAVFGGVREAVRVVTPWSLLREEGYRSGREGGFCDGMIDLIPDLVVGFVREKYIQERFDAVEVEVAGV